ncbi:type I-E CRISPR-associated protein Cas6/Cse3/CasE [Amycolatopsis sp. EV170708-02-1]|uniref:type I-E CRISPR-associated protein Cas6/Cse3/CasE n=1 Tax=Amycolatopsis sp. EV170708-02-1 TaxID=2919322 RepID=UPI001F0BE96F|nr:type I-E CRISPR-associated protein Cas6/Cse3/CasE [Amycolatopsis sp. EV170708-02-1]UMO99992.1 type I-E CRISPR-associated protein Cas6/Cse3/CasE [Amycolatopsis sp. EV170708-02-1]
MHLTRFQINPARRGARELLASPHRMHGAVLAAFPPDRRDATTDGRVLWRLDQRAHQTTLYIVSPHEPELTHLVEAAGWAAAPGDTRPYAPLLHRLTAGDMWAFRLTANPVRSTRKTDDATRSQRFGHVTVKQQTTWLLDRANGHGFTIPEGTGKEPDVAVHSRRTWRFQRQGKAVTLATATFEGRLEITDPDAFRHALAHGIGPAKGYGCGLLTIARMT